MDPTRHVCVDCVSVKAATASLFSSSECLGVQWMVLIPQVTRSALMILLSVNKELSIDVELRRLE